MDILLVADHRLAREAALAALAADDRVDRVTVTDRRPGRATEANADVVLLEQSVDAISLADVDEVLQACPGACVITLALVGRDRYAWVALRRTTGWYLVEGAGEGPMQSLLGHVVDPGARAAPA
jgi:DNA-binding NarL/FixJ family response regulator